MPSAFHRLRRSAFLAASLLGLAAPLVCGQDPGDWQPVDPGAADVGPLDAGLRDVPPGLRAPSAFDGVYRVSGRADLFARIDGGLYAVFPQSQYAAGPAGSVAIVPSGTVFYIGPPTDLRPAPALGGDAPFRLDGRMDARTNRRRAAGEASSSSRVPLSNRPESSPGRRPEPAAPAAGPRIVTDAAYRAARLHDLLERAARAPGR